MNYQNPQQDDFDEVMINSLRQSVNSQERPKSMFQKFCGAINFVEFLMFFYRSQNITKLIDKDLMKNKSLKLSHMICLLGHQYLMKGTLDYLSCISTDEAFDTLD